MATAHHVWANASDACQLKDSLSFTQQLYLGAKRNDLGLDIALIPASGCECRNSMALMWLPRVELKEGESVWKVGAATGLTEGRISEAVFDNVVTNGQLYNRVIKVSWMDDVPFAKGGDCGSFYVVRRGPSTFPWPFT